MSFAQVVIVLLLVALLFVLIAGIVLMATGGKLNEKYGNALMKARVGVQAGIVVLLILLFATQ